MPNPINPAASLASDTWTPDSLINGDTDSLSTEKVTLISGQNVVRGAVLGKITASGKYNLSLSAAADGSQVPDTICVQDCDATSADAECLVYRTGRFNANALTLGTAHTIASIKDGLRAKGILLINSTLP
jgi:hypothetical protein